ncbi:2-dehydropantoate 2-reductase [Xylanibacter muris]|uniref:2-dehydropantoate 2-reductase n=1 Tax=Xylanibacter muris TaxID=2736290 RepID=A0ABX2AMT3_9BACT|nr:2-dehydropantoate 2-reductase [Xylanibacter muris]NPD91557.1 2-dehydropantoate 2-reductase [Xylanibacter muris]
MRYGIVGTGAVGGYFGGLLAKAGRDVHFLLHSDYHYVRQNGLRVDSVDGDFILDNINVYDSTSAMPECDVVFVAMKTTSNGMLAAMLPPLLHDNTLVILIQNGIGVEEDVQALLPGVRLAAGLAYICTTKVGPGHIWHQSNGRLSIGDYSCGDEAFMDAVVADMTDAGLRVNRVGYNEARWKKAVWNMPFNGMTVVMNTDCAGLIDCRATERLIRMMMLEVVGAARACGVEGVDESYAMRMIDMTRHMPSYSSSMKADYDNGRPMEIRYLYARPIEIAAGHGFKMPMLSMLAAQLEFMDGRK